METNALTARLARAQQLADDTRPALEIMYAWGELQDRLADHEVIHDTYPTRDEAAAAREQVAKALAEQTKTFDALVTEIKANTACKVTHYETQPGPRGHIELVVERGFDILSVSIVSTMIAAANVESSSHTVNGSAYPAPIELADIPAWLNT